MDENRVFIKLSGELLRGKGDLYPVNPAILGEVADEICLLLQNGYQLCLTIGGGNIFRGRYADGSTLRIGITRDSADKMGLIATAINGIAFKDILYTTFVKNGFRNRIRLFSDTVSFPLAERFNDNIDVVEADFAAGHVYLFAGIGASGLGITSDTVAAERAVKTRCSRILKGTNVDGVYDDDIRLNPHAKKFSRITATEFLSRRCKVMDRLAVERTMVAGIPIRVFQCTSDTIHNLSRILLGNEDHGTLIIPE